MKLLTFQILCALSSTNAFLIPQPKTLTQTHAASAVISSVLHAAPAEEVDQQKGTDEAFSDGDKLTAEVQDANKRFLGHIQVKRVNEHQWGVFTCRQFTKGSTVISSSLLTDNKNPSPESCRHSIQIDWDKHILMELPARFLNHSCDPSIGVGGVNEGGSYDFVALRDIDAGEEVRFDYETTEYEIGAFSECHCGAVNCRGSIRGYKHNSDAIRAKYGGYNVAEYLL